MNQRPLCHFEPSDCVRQESRLDVLATVYQRDGRALVALANVLDGKGLPRDHAEVALRRLEFSKDPRVEDQNEYVEALSGAGMALMYSGEYEQALTHLLEAEELAAKVQNIGQQVGALGLQGQCYFRLDRWDEVLSIEPKWRDLERRFSRQRTGPT